MRLEFVPGPGRVSGGIGPEALCFHEAGHAVAGYALGYPIEEVVARPQAFAGHVQFERCPPIKTGGLAHRGQGLPLGGAT